MRLKIEVPDDPAGLAAPANFLAAIARTGVLAAHPDMIAVLDERVPRWRDLFGARRVIDCWWLDRSCLYTGDVWTGR